MISVFFWGLLASFVGSLPPGVISFTTVQHTRESGSGAGFRFAAISALLELLHLLPAIALSHWLMSEPLIMQIFDLTAVLFFLVLGFATWYKPGQPESKWLNFSWKRGLLINFLNPAAIPYWLFVTTVLQTQGALPEHYSLTVYALSAAMGTFLALALYVRYADRFLNFVLNPRFPLQRIISLLFMALAAQQLLRWLL